METQDGTRAIRILVIDDNHDAADSMALLLKIWGYNVRVVYHSAEALSEARDFLPDCVLSDIALPGLDGYRLAQQFRQDERLNRTTLIAISGYLETERAKAAGYEHLFLKPVDPLTLQPILGRIIAMDQRIQHLEAQTEKHVEVVTEVRDLVKEVKNDVKQIKEGLHEDVKELKEELKEVKNDVKEIKEELKDVKGDEAK